MTSVPQPESASLSYRRGADVPLLERTLSQALSHTAARFPGREALVVCHQNVHLTWSELDAEVTRTARGLAGLGLNAGDRIGIWASNCLEWVLLQYATARAGLILVNVNPAYRSHELRFVLQRSHIRALFLHAADSRANYREILAQLPRWRPAAARARRLAGRRLLAGDDSIPAATIRSMPARRTTSPTSSTLPAPPALPRA